MRGGGSAMYYSPLETTTAYGSFMWGRIFKWPDDFFRGTWRIMMRRRSYSGSQAAFREICRWFNQNRWN